MSLQQLRLAPILLLLLSCNLSQRSNIEIKDVENIAFESSDHIQMDQNLSLSIRKSGNYRIKYYCNDSTITKEGMLTHVEMSSLINSINNASYLDTSSLKIIRVYPSHQNYQRFSISLKNGLQIDDPNISAEKEAIMALLLKIGMQKKTEENARNNSKCR